VSREAWEQDVNLEFATSINTSVMSRHLAVWACLANFCHGRLVSFAVQQSTCLFSRAGAGINGHIRGGRS